MGAIQRRDLSSFLSVPLHINGKGEEGKNRRPSGCVQQAAVRSGQGCDNVTGCYRIMGPGWESPRQQSLGEVS